MRILMIHNRYGVHARGGAERVLEILADALAARGHEVHVATPDIWRGSGNGERRVHSAVVVHRICVPNLAPFHRLGMIPLPLRVAWHALDQCNVLAARSLRQAIHHVQPDVIHTHNLLGCGGLAPRAIRRCGIPWVHTLHDVQLVTPSGLLIRDVPPTRVEQSVVGRIARSMRRRMFGNPAVVVSPTRWLLALHRQHGFFPESRDVVIGNPVPVARVPVMRTGAVRTLLFIGQVEGHKGIYVLVEAYRELRSRFPDIALHVIGDGGATPQLRRMMRDLRGFVLRGRLDAGAVTRALVDADVLVVPSLTTENQPSVILEAYAAGLPVVASRVGGIPEIVHDGETGFLVDPGSSEDLVRSLRLCVDRPDVLRDMTDACWREAAAHDASAVAERYEAVYTSAVTGRWCI